jgi:hypothetical protein
MLGTFDATDPVVDPSPARSFFHKTLSFSQLQSDVGL